MLLCGPGARSVPRSRVSPGRSWARRLARTAWASAGEKLPMLEPMLEGEGCGCRAGG